VLPDLLAGTWDLSWLPLLVSPFFHPMSLCTVIKLASHAVGKVGVFSSKERRCFSAGLNLSEEMEARLLSPLLSELFFLLLFCISHRRYFTPSLSLVKALHCVLSSCCY